MCVYIYTHINTNTFVSEFMLNQWHKGCMTQVVLRCQHAPRHLAFRPRFALHILHTNITDRKKKKIWGNYGILQAAERILCEFFLLELRIPVRIPERISVRISQVRCSLSWKVQTSMENPSQNPQRNPQQNSHGRVGEIFTDFFCRVGSIRN